MGSSGINESTFFFFFFFFYGVFIFFLKQILKMSSYLYEEINKDGEVKKEGSLKRFTNQTISLKEKIPLVVYEDNVVASLNVAKLIRNKIIEKQELNEDIVLGLATGSTPKKIYAELVKFHREEGLSFKNGIKLFIFNYIYLFIFPFLFLFFHFLFSSLDN